MILDDVGYFVVVNVERASASFRPKRSVGAHQKLKAQNSQFRSAENGAFPYTDSSEAKIRDESPLHPYILLAHYLC